MLLNFYHRHKVVLDNIFFVGLVQVFGLLAPLVTYPYLVKVLGMDIYGLVLTAQVLVSYAVLVIDFGSNVVCVKDISISRSNKTKLSEIVCSVMLLRFKLWLLCLMFYVVVVFSIPLYRDNYVLFLLSYVLTFNELLFPQFYFQGIEKMKVIAALNILVKLIFILLVFFVVTDEVHFLFVPILYGIGYFVAGALSLYLIFKKEGLSVLMPSHAKQIQILKECSPVLATDVVCTLKDKLNYTLIGLFVSMQEVVVYDLGIKLIGILQKPFSIIASVFLPRVSVSRDVKKIKWLLILCTLGGIVMVILLNLFLPYVVDFFLHKQIDMVPLRLFSLVPVFLAPSILIANNFFIGFGYNRYLLYSILVTTLVYTVLLSVFFLQNYVHSLYAFVFLSVISYFIEFAYRTFMYLRLSKCVN